MGGDDIKMYLKQIGWRTMANECGFWQGPLSGCCAEGDLASGNSKGGTFLDQLRNC